MGEFDNDTCSFGDSCMRDGGLITDCRLSGYRIPRIDWMRSPIAERTTNNRQVGALCRWVRRRRWWVGAISGLEDGSPLLDSQRRQGGPARNKKTASKNRGSGRPKQNEEGVELKVGFEPTTCGLRSRGDPSWFMNLNWIGYFLKASGIQKSIWIPIWIPPDRVMDYYRQADSEVQITTSLGKLLHFSFRQVLRPEENNTPAKAFRPEGVPS